MYWSYPQSKVELGTYSCRQKSVCNTTKLITLCFELFATKMAHSTKRVHWACFRYNFSYVSYATMVLGSSPFPGIAANCTCWMRERLWRSRWDETARSRAQHADNRCLPSIAVRCSTVIQSTAVMCCARNVCRKVCLVVRKNCPVNVPFASRCGMHLPKHLVS